MKVQQISFDRYSHMWVVMDNGFIYKHIEPGGPDGGEDYWVEHNIVEEIKESQKKELEKKKTT